MAYVFPRRTVLSLGLFAVALVVAIACFGNGAAIAREKLKVVATTGMIADAAQRIGGEFVEVKGLMGPGVDPHSYRQTRSDIVAMAQADLVLWHGLYLEAQLEDFMLRLAKTQNVAAVADTLPKDVLIAHQQYENKFDPHVWMDPTMWSHVVDAIRDTLIATIPEHEADIRKNASDYAVDLEKLAAYGKTALASVPAGSRVLVTAHDAFNYFGRAHDFEVIGIQGISTESEAGINRIAELVDLLVERRIKAVFVETSVSDRNIRALIEGARAKGHDVQVGGELFSDAMGVPGTYEGTYLGMLDHNITTITRALGGDVPERGMVGKLSTGS